MPLDLLDRIRSFPLFVSAPESFLAAIGKHLRPQVHSPHDVILTEGDDAKAMYWLVRGAVAVTSRDGEATYAELKPGAFFGEIGILMDVPRTATIIARTKCLLVVLKKENLKQELPNFPSMERAIMEEAQERLTILNKKRVESGYGPKVVSASLPSRGGKLAREAVPGEVTTGEAGIIEKGTVINTRKRKSPSPGVIEDPTAGSALGSGFVNVRQTLKELPLFSALPPDILHFLGLSTTPKTYPPFTDIITQGSPGNEIYFIVRGEAEVIHESPKEVDLNHSSRASYVRPRLKPGQYFGEVASLALAPRRTATVRSITTVECLMLSGEVLEELWRRCPPGIRQEVEQTAKTRIATSEDGDVVMTDTSAPAINNLELHDRSSKPLPQVTFTPSKPASPHKPHRAEDKEVLEPLDPDPYLSVDMDNMRARSRRGSHAPPITDETTPEVKQSPTSDFRPGSINFDTSRPHTPSKSSHVITPPDSDFRPKRPKIIQRRHSQYNRGPLPDNILIKIFSYLDIYPLMRLRAVSLHWSKLLTTSPELCQYLDLSIYNRKVTNKALIDSICPFVGKRARTVDISNCFHIADEGFAALSLNAGQHVHCWRMKSVWDISANAVLEMANNAKELEEIDLSNCRKVSDNLLARIVGWVVPENPPPQARALKNGTQGQSHSGPPPGTVIGCPDLKRLTLSYCKHVTDRSMAHLAVHAHSRLQSIDLTRCTTITDQGFQHWSLYKFTKLEKLILADCTYLTDNAIVYLTNAAKGLKELDLVSFPFSYDPD